MIDKERAARALRNKFRFRKPKSEEALVTIPELLPEGFHRDPEPAPAGWMVPVDPDTPKWVIELQQGQLPRLAVRTERLSVAHELLIYSQREGAFPSERDLGIRDRESYALFRSTLNYLGGQYLRMIGDGHYHLTVWAILQLADQGEPEAVAEVELLARVAEALEQAWMQHDERPEGLVWTVAAFADEFEIMAQEARRALTVLSAVLGYVNNVGPREADGSLKQFAIWSPPLPFPPPNEGTLR